MQITLLGEIRCDALEKNMKKVFTSETTSERSKREMVEEKNLSPTRLEAENLHPDDSLRCFFFSPLLQHGKASEKLSKRWIMCTLFRATQETRTTTINHHL